MQLTYPATAALAVVRVQGLRAAAFVAARFDKPVIAGRCVYGDWRDDSGEVFDDLLVVADEHGFDLNLHGGRRIVAGLLEQAAAAGFRVVTGEAAIAAIAQNELEAWLPRATTGEGLRMLLAQPASWAALGPEAVDIAALLADQTLRRLLNPATVAIVGQPNVGKSTLANALSGQERSIVADIPGTTRDWVGGTADLAGLPVVLVDTPGQRDTSDEIELEAIALSRSPVASADLVLMVSDATRPEEISSDDGWGVAAGVACLEVANKSDLAEAPAGRLAVSAMTGQGLAELVTAIHRKLGVDLSNAHRANVWTSGQETLLRGSGAPAVHQIAHRLRS